MCIVQEDYKDKDLVLIIIFIGEFFRWYVELGVVFVWGVELYVQFDSFFLGGFFKNIFVQIYF